MKSKEQEEASIFDVIMSAIEEHLTGFEYVTTTQIDEHGNLVIHIVRQNKPEADLCRVDIKLQI